MISDRCDFEEFVAVANEWNYQDIITNADREATEAERRFYHSNVSENEKALCGHDYAECLRGSSPSCATASNQPVSTRKPCSTSRVSGRRPCR